jgi:hypothetical protein
MDGSDEMFKDNTAIRNKVKDMAYSLADNGEEWEKKILKLNLLGFKAPGGAVSQEKATKALPSPVSGHQVPWSHYGP